MQHPSRPFVHAQTPSLSTMATAMTAATLTASTTTANMPVSTPASISAPSTGPGPVSAPGPLFRPVHTRAPSHTLSSLAISPINTNNRINRRKSVTSAVVTHANAAAVASAIDASPLALPGPSSKRHVAAASMSLSSSTGTGPVNLAVSTIPPAQMPPRFMPGVKRESADVGEEVMSRMQLGHGSLSPSTPDSGLNDQSRLRRASEGQPLVREGGKRFNRIELRCDTCGKSYKHSSCLTKHLWEHTPEWSYTSKLLISKHQQVQLLEAASVLVAMNHNDPKSDTMTASPSESTSGFHSETDSSSLSDAASRRHDRTSSTETTPPPPMEGLGLKLNSHQFSTKRYSTGGISKAYKLGSHRPSTSVLQGIASSVPNGTSLGHGHGHGRKRSEDIRPTSSGRSSTGKVDRELAAAVEMLSCSFNSNHAKSPNTAVLIPPVPALPIQYLEQATSFASSGFTSFPSRPQESFTRGESFIRGGAKSLHSHDDMDMDDSASEGVAGDDDDYDMRRARSDEDDDGVFGRMEE
ncbi:hypothetical protein BROUX41_002480 [Berkeleyomyces rouxiae]